MDRSRSLSLSHSKRGFDYDRALDSPPRRRRPRLSRSPPPPPPAATTTTFRILCPESCFPAVLGNSGGFIKAVRHDTGAWVDVHELTPGDNERIIEASDGAPPSFSPAENAMARIHARIVDAILDEEVPDEHGRRGRRARETRRIVSKMVVPHAHAGCLLGKGGRIIERLRADTRTHIRIPPRDQYTPRCVSPSEEIVQVVGYCNAVKKAVTIILSLLKESLHRDPGPFRGRLKSPEHSFSPDDDIMNDTHHRSPLESSDKGSLFSVGGKRTSDKLYGSQQSSYAFKSDANPVNTITQSFSNEHLVFRILCPNEKVESVMGVPHGILEMLQGDVGVHVRATDPVPGSKERIIIITSEEGPDDVLFPAQEALLHIQTHIVDLGPDKDNIISTRLLLKDSEIGCLEGDRLLANIRKLTNANVQILPKEDHPLCAAESDELVQIVGEISAARKALVEVTEKLRSFLYRDISTPKDMPMKSSSREGYQRNDLPGSFYQNLKSSMTMLQSKHTGGSTSRSLEREASRLTGKERKSGAKRFIEMIIPEHAIPSLMKGSVSNIAKISEMSGATVTLLEDRPEITEKVVQIIGSPENTERAQCLLQGFILGTL